MITKLFNQALLKVSGRDAKVFLQNQLTNDINKLADNKAQLNAYCQHQGRVIAVFWVFKKGNDFYLSFNVDIVDIVIKRLRMFILMADVAISNVSDSIVQLGFIDKKCKDGFVLNKRQSIALITIDELKKYTTQHYVFWEEVSIKMGVPSVSLETTGVFIPQMLNLDINNLGVSFSKGCYPGQEIVARLHYLGKAKKRMALFSGNGSINVGDSLIVVDALSSKALGTVVRSANLSDKSICLATINIAKQNEQILLNDTNGVRLTRLNCA